MGAVKREKVEKDYREYVTDVLNGLVVGMANIGHIPIGEVPRWVDIAYNHNGTKRKQTKTADDIVNDIVKRGGLVIKHEST